MSRRKTSYMYNKLNISEADAARLVIFRKVHQYWVRVSSIKGGGFDRAKPFWLDLRFLPSIMSVKHNLAEDLKKV